MNLTKIALAGCVAALALAAAAFASVGTAGSSGSSKSASDEVQRFITVSGSGTVSVVPDRAHFSFGVDTKAKTATEALSENGAAMRKVIAALRAAGIDPVDIRTEQVSLSPDYNDDGTAVIGYSASNSVSVLVRKLADAGGLIDHAVAAGANQVDGPSLDREDVNALYRKALEAAMADARSKAEVLATGSGLTLGRVSQVSETTSEPPVLAASKDVATGSATPIEGGSTGLQATVSVTYEAG